MAGNRKVKIEEPLLTALYTSVEEKPDDVINLQALADWYEERNQVQIVQPLRWLIAEKKYPFRYDKNQELRFQFDGWHMGWYWWTTGEEGLDWGHPSTCVLPHNIWKKLRHSFDYNPLVFREYPTMRCAIVAFIAAWSRKRAWYRRTNKGSEK